MTPEQAEATIRAAFPDRPMLEVFVQESPHAWPNYRWSFYAGKATRMRRVYRSIRSLEEAVPAVIAKLKAE